MILEQIHDNLLCNTVNNLHGQFANNEASWFEFNLSQVNGWSEVHQFHDTINHTETNSNGDAQVFEGHVQISGTLNLQEWNNPWLQGQVSLNIDGTESQAEASLQGKNVHGYIVHWEIIQSADDGILDVTVDSEEEIK